MNSENNIQEESNYNTSVFKKIYSIFDFASFKSNKVVYYDIENNKRNEDKSAEQIMLDLL
jgi:hypothetical protein